MRGYPPRWRRDGAWVRRRGGRGVGGPALAHDAEQRNAPLHHGRDALTDGRFRFVAVRREHEQSVGHRRQPGERTGRKVEEQQGVFDPEAAMQLLPARVREQVAGVRRHRSRADEEHSVHLARRLGERHVVLERVDDSLGGCETDGLVKGGMLQPQVHEGDAPLAQRRGARDVPRRARGPLEVAARGHQRHEGLACDERRHEPVEARAWQGADGHGVGW